VLPVFEPIDLGKIEIPQTNSKFARVGASPLVGADLGAHSIVWTSFKTFVSFFVAKPSLNATLE
jgi:hypothetical protein